MRMWSPVRQAWRKALRLLSPVRRLILILYLTVMAFSGCGFWPVIEDFVDPEFTPYVQIYLSHKADFTGDEYLYEDINIAFSDLAGTRMGECVISSVRDKRIIRIDRGYWDILNETEREILIVHEMGHCDLSIYEHIPESIMQERGYSARLYLEKQGEELFRLFNRYQGEL